MVHVRRLGIRRATLRKVPQSTRNYVNRRINGSAESHQRFVATASAALNNTPVITDLSAVAQGDGRNQRDGDKIEPFSLMINYEARSSVSNVLGAGRVMVLSTRVEGTPVIADVLNDATFPAALNSQLETIPMLSKVIFDRHFNLDTDTSTGSRTKNIRIRLDKRHLPASIKFDPAATTAPKNKLWLVSFGEQNTNAATFSMEALLNYKDK